MRRSMVSTCQHTSSAWSDVDDQDVSSKEIIAGSSFCDDLVPASGNSTAR